MSGWRLDLDQPSANSAAMMMDGFLALSSVAASEARGLARRASCTLVRYYVARYTAANAEAWVRSEGAKEAEILIAGACIKPQLTALQGHVADKTDQ